MASNNHSIEKSIAPFLRIESAGGPSFSHGASQFAGREISFVYNSSGNYQIYSILSRYPGSWPNRLTFTDDRTTNPEFAPNGALFYSQDTNGDEKWAIYRYFPGKGEEPTLLTPDVGVIHRLGVMNKTHYYFTSNKRDSKIFDIYYGTLDGKPGEYQLLIKNPGINILSVIDYYTNDKGEWLLIREEVSNFESSLFIFNMNEQKLIPITSIFSHGKHARWENGWFVNDSLMLVVSDFGRDFLSLGVLNWQEPLEVHWLEPDQWDTEYVDFHLESKRIVYTKNFDGYSRLYIAQLTEKKQLRIKEMPLPEHAVIEGGDMRSFVKPLRFSPLGDRLAMTLSSPRSPLNIWIYELRDNYFGYWQLTQADGAGIPTREYIIPELHRFNSLHNLKVPVFLYLPKIHSPPYPCIVWIHGGPEAQIRPSFNPIIQFFLAAGFAIATPNVRGSTGYGRRYSSLDDVEKRLDSVADIKYLVDFLKEDQRIDNTKLAVYGGSYGGYMVLASVTEYPTLFQAAVDIVGISNFITFLENTAAWRRHLREKEYGSLTMDTELLQRISPINKVDKIITPTMLVHGVNDERVPLSEAEQIHAQLKSRNISTEFIQFYDEGHGIVKLKNKLNLYPAILRFLQHHLNIES